MSEIEKVFASSPSFGILTLATPNDYLKAIGLALSLRISNPGVPLAVACSQSVAPFVAPYFDHVVEEHAGLRGFVHKVYLDQYSPFDETLFFDSDVLVFKSVRPYVDKWRAHAYTACGKYLTEGKSTFGMDRAKILRKIGKSRLVVIDGAGHAFFRKPDCHAVMDLAREITRTHAEYMGAIPYADEDVMDVVMTKLDLPPMPYTDFFSRCSSAMPGTLRMDATKGLCSFIVREGTELHPCMMHFAANEAPFVYHYQLRKLLRQANAPTTHLWKSAIEDAYQLYIRLRLHSIKTRVFSLR